MHFNGEDDKEDIHLRHRQYPSKPQGCRQNNSWWWRSETAVDGEGGWVRNMLFTAALKFTVVYISKLWIIAIYSPALDLKMILILINDFAQTYS